MSSVANELITSRSVISGRFSLHSGTKSGGGGRPPLATRSNREPWHTRGQLQRKILPSWQQDGTDLNYSSDEDESRDDIKNSPSPTSIGSSYLSYDSEEDIEEPFKKLTFSKEPPRVLIFQKAAPADRSMLYYTYSELRNMMLEHDWEKHQEMKKGNRAFRETIYNEI